MNPEPDYTPQLIGIRRMLRAILGVLLLHAGAHSEGRFPAEITMVIGTVLLLVSFIQWLFNPR